MKGRSRPSGPQCRLSGSRQRVLRNRGVGTKIKRNHVGWCARRRRPIFFDETRFRLLSSSTLPPHPSLRVPVQYEYQIQVTVMRRQSTDRNPASKAVESINATMKSSNTTKLLRFKQSALPELDSSGLPQGKRWPTHNLGPLSTQGQHVVTNKTVR